MSTNDKVDLDERPKHLSQFRLVIDQARIDEDVLSYVYPGIGTITDPYVITWIPNDAGNPMNWKSSLKRLACMMAAWQCFVTAFASSAFSGTFRELLQGFHASAEPMTAGISLFVLGFAIAPLLWAPLSEIFGRQVVFTVTFGAYTAFSAACIGAQNITTILVLRFFAGAFGSSPFTNGGGVIADVFSAKERGSVMTFFALAPSLAPSLGPFIGGFLGESQGWRWVMILLTVLAAVTWVAGSALVPETYAPVLLRKRAEAMSKMTGKVYVTKMQAVTGGISCTTIIVTAMIRPWVLLFREPIVMILSLYMAINYGTLYLLFGAFPIVFQLERGWSEGVGGLAFLGVAVGMLAAIVFMGPLGKRYQKAIADNGGTAPPEARLPGAMVGAIALPIGMFWFAWTTYPSIHWISPVMAGAPFGFGMTLVFLSLMSYLIDTYTIFAASVLAAATVLRSLFGAAFPLFTRDMCETLGTQWASSIPGFLALACIPFPFILYKYGAAIRQKCTYAAQSEAAMEELRAQLPASTNTSEGNSTRMGSVGSDSTDMSDDEVSEEPLKLVKTKPKTAGEGLHKTKSHVGSIAEAVGYDASPFDIDRVHTRISISGFERS